MESPFARRFFFSLVFFLASKNSLLFHRLFLCLSLFSSSIYPNVHSTGLWRPDPETLVDNGKCSPIFLIGSSQVPTCTPAYAQKKSFKKLPLSDLHITGNLI